MSKLVKLSAAEISKWFNDSAAVIVNDDFICYPIVGKNSVKLAQAPDMDADDIIRVSIKDDTTAEVHDDLSYTFNGVNVRRLMAEKKLPEQTIVTVIENNAVRNMFSFTNTEEAEMKFNEMIRNLITSLDEDDLDSALDDGYYEDQNSNLTVCISHPE